MPEEPDAQPETEAPPKPSVDAGDYVIAIGKKYLNKRLKDVEPAALQSFVDWVKDNFKNPNALTLEFIQKAEAYLAGG